MADGDSRNIRLTHDADQARATLSEVAVLLGRYHKQLVAEGFSEAQAFALTVQIQAQLMSARRRD